MATDMTIPNEIKRQLYCLDKNLMWGLGANSFSGNETTLFFKVQGVKHKGFVSIHLNGLDLYDIEIFKIRAGVTKVIKTLDDAYAEDLPGILEENCY